MKLKRTQPDRWTLQLNYKELMALRGIAWNSDQTVNAIVIAHQSGRTVPEDGPSVGCEYTQLLKDIWTNTNGHYARQTPPRGCDDE